MVFKKGGLGGLLMLFYKGIVVSVLMLFLTDCITLFSCAKITLEKWGDKSGYRTK